MKEKYKIFIETYTIYVPPINACVIITSSTIIIPQIN